MKYDAKQTRKFTIDGVDATRAKDSAFISMSLSSETPCLRAFGNEILMHGTENIDMSRTMPNGLPLLVSHNDMELPIGRLKNIRLDPETRKLRGDAYFSGRPEAQAVRQDIEDGILTDISVGYRILDHRIEPSGTRGVPNNFMVTRWAPHEASLVAVGFDPAAGVGRSDTESGSFEIEDVVDPESTTEDETRKMVPMVPAEATEDPAEEATETPAEEATEDATEPCCAACSDTCDGTCCDACCKMADKPARSLPAETKIEPPADLLSDDLIALRTIALKLNIRTANEVDAILAQTSDITAARSLLLNSPHQPITQKEPAMLTHDTFTRALANALKGDFNFDESMAGLITQTDKRSFNADLFGTSTRANEMTTSSPSSAVYETNIGFLELLKARACVLQAGARTRTGNGVMSYLRQTGAITASLRAENSGPITNSTVTMDRVTYQPHALTAKVWITDELQKDSIVDLQNKLRIDMVSQFALAIDQLAISGSTSPSVAGLLKAGSGIYNGDLAVAGKPTFPDIIHLKALVDQKAVSLDSCAYILTPGLMGFLESTPKFTNGTAIADSNKINGYKAFTSANMPIATANHSILFGDFSFLEICLMGPTEFLIDTTTRFDEGISILHARQTLDLGILQKVAFASGTNYQIV